MNRRKTINQLMTTFSEDKKFYIDGFYRIRTIDENTVELAYLIAGPCGESIVHPQITVSLKQNQAIGISLIDMDSSPPSFLHRDSNNAHEIDTTLDLLIEKFLQTAKKYQD